MPTTEAETYPSHEELIVYPSFIYFTEEGSRVLVQISVQQGTDNIAWASIRKPDYEIVVQGKLRRTKQTESGRPVEVVYFVSDDQSLEIELPYFRRELS